MTLVLSSSSPWVSAAIFDQDDLVATEEAHVGRGSPGVLLGMVRRLVDFSRPTEIVADIGPGGFTATRSGLTLAKSLAWAWSVPLGTVTAFDLMGASESPIVIRLSRESFVVRNQGKEPERCSEVPTAGAGYGVAGMEELFPLARRFERATIVESDPFLAVPGYMAEPNISVPNRPYGGLAP